MKTKSIILTALAAISVSAFAEDVNLPVADMQAGLPVMEAFANRKSVRSFSDKQLSEQQLSNLLWAAMGQNRSNGKLTAPSCLNYQEIRLYVFDKNGVSEYIPANHSLRNVVKGDYRSLVAGAQDFAKSAPVCLVMIADMSKYGNLDERSKMFASVDAGIVSQNISLACAGLGFATVPRGTMQSDDILKLLGLSSQFIPIINNPVGFEK